MAEKKGKQRRHWLHGERREIETALIREMQAGTRTPLREHEIEKVKDELSLQGKELTAEFPEVVLNDGKQRICEMQAVPSLKNILVPRRANYPVDRIELRDYFIKKRKLSAQEAELECDAVEIRRDPTLLSLRDAWQWLQKAESALTSGRAFAKEIAKAKGGNARRAASIQSEQAFSRAVSLAYYAGVACAELKALVRFDEIYGSDKNPKRKGRFSKLRDVTFAEFRRLRVATSKLTNDDLRDAIAQQSNGIEYVNGHFCWVDMKGRSKKVSDRAWQNIVTSARKSVMD